MYILLYIVREHLTLLLWLRLAVGGLARPLARAMVTGLAYPSVVVWGGVLREKNFFILYFYYLIEIIKHVTICFIISQLV